MRKGVLVGGGALAGALLGVIACVAVDSWLSPPGTFLGISDELGLSHEVAPVLAGLVLAVVGGFLGRLGGR
jgi:hypothetical protein